jgi:hypothetical protein
MESNSEQDIRSFWKEYQKIASSKSLPGRIRSSRCCRFCGKPEGVVSFRNKAHAISELLGKNDLLIFDECDTCNAKFSPWEVHMSQFFMPYLSIIGTKGKNGTRGFRSRTENNDEATRMTLKKDNLGKLNLNVQLFDDVDINEKDKTIRIKFRQSSLSKFLVFKALSKIALSLLPSAEVPNFRPLYDWLLQHENSSVPYIASAFITVMKKTMRHEPVAELYESTKDVSKDPDAWPKFTMVLWFANLAVQIFLAPSRGPIAEGGSNTALQLHYFPAFIFDHALDPELQVITDPKTIITLDFLFTHEDLKSEAPEERDEVIEFTYRSQG